MSDTNTVNPLVTRLASRAEKLTRRTGQGERQASANRSRRSRLRQAAKPSQVKQSSLRSRSHLHSVGSQKRATKEHSPYGVNCGGTVLRR